MAMVFDDEIVPDPPRVIADDTPVKELLGIDRLKPVRVSPTLLDAFPPEAMVAKVAFDPSQILVREAGLGVETGLPATMTDTQTEQAV
jgi:hypothetical protein